MIVLLIFSWCYAQLEELKKEQGNIHKAIKEASSALRLVLQEAAEIRLLEKEKNKSPSCAIRIYVRINKVVWSMLSDDKPFAEAEINDMVSFFVIIIMIFIFTQQ